MSDRCEELAAAVAASQLRKIRVVAWRDLDDPEAGGSELHMDEIARRWAQAGLRVDVRTSAVPGQPARKQRHGYYVERRGGRYQVFPEVMWRGWRYDRRSYDALLEIWNGVPFFGPLWFRGPRLTLIHHVHEAMWRLAMPRPIADFGWWIEHRFSPMFYRRGGVVTDADSAAVEIREILGIKHVDVVPLGISTFYSPGAERSAAPLVCAVGRLVPVKRFDELIRQFVRAHAQLPDAQFVIAGEGYLRHDLEALVDELDAGAYISLPGRISDEDLRDLYRRSWLVTSNSQREGWGMSLTEAAACGTPCVVVDIAGHRDAVHDGISGVLVPESKSLADAIVEVLGDRHRREELSRGALEFSGTLSWDAAALGLFRLLDARSPR